jgi:hypothetical protein
MVRRVKTLKTIGHIDYLDVLDADIEKIPFKVDTGADTSAIHCERVRIKLIDDKEYLSFRLLDRTHPLFNGREIVTDDFKEKKVKSSFGDYEFRYQVKLRIRLFNKIYPVRFNLSNRKNMKYPILLGRRFLKGRFVVDVSKSFLSETPKTDPQS